MKQLLEIILARLNEIPGLRNIELFNNQLTHRVKHNEVLFFPAAYLDITGIDYETWCGDIQSANATIRVQVVNESPLQGADFEIYELKDTVHKYLHKYTNGYFMELERTKETFDINHDNLYVYTIEYVTVFKELTQLDADDDVLVDEVELQYDLYDDNDEIIIDKIIPNHNG